MTKTNKFWNMVILPNAEAEISILGEVVPTGWEWEGDTSAHSFKKDLDKLGDIETINLHINSPGGSVFEGVAIGSMLKQHKAKVNVYVDGLAASIASVIAMSGDAIFMPKNAMMMVHNPWNVMAGNAKDFRKAADDLDKIGSSMKESYLMKAGEKLPGHMLDNLLDNETWLSAHEAFNYGLCDEILDENTVAASVSDDLFAKYRNVPKSLSLKKEEIPKQEKKDTESLINKKLQLLK
ncbi:MAG: Clp protease ClpP [Vagococcus sp.]